MEDSTIQQIKDRLDIVEVIGSYIKLQKAGANWRAICPFHAEKTPSFFVSPARQIWHCFGSCGTGGDIFKFVMQIEGIEFGDALKLLAQKAGVELKRFSPQMKTERARLYEICDLSSRFFEKQLESKTGQGAKEYLLGRGINESSIKDFRLGYSPDTWQGLSDFLVGRGYKRDEVERAGLSVKKEGGGSYDRFRGRIIFPVFDANSQVIGFGGRVFKYEDTAKYVNTPATLLYDKSSVLYGLDKAKMDIRKKDSAILVEGYTDVIMLHQAGWKNVVATSGTALTPFQLRILKRYSDRLLTAFDMDLAGNSATKRGIDLAQTEGFNIKVITMTPGLDPADMIRQNPSQWEELVSQARSILQFYFETAMERVDPKTPEGKKEMAKILLPVLKRIPDKIELAFWIQEMARALGVREDDVREELAKVKVVNFAPSAPLAGVDSPKTDPPKITTRKELLEEHLLSLVLKSPQHLALLGGKDLECFSPLACQALECCQKAVAFPAELTDFVNRLSLRAEIEELGEPEAAAEIKNCLEAIKYLTTKNKMNQISLAVKESEEKGELVKTQELAEEFNQLAKEMEE